MDVRRVPQVLRWYLPVRRRCHLACAPAASMRPRHQDGHARCPRRRLNAISRNQAALCQSGPPADASTHESAQGTWQGSFRRPLAARSNPQVPPRFWPPHPWQYMRLEPRAMRSNAQRVKKKGRNTRRHVRTYGVVRWSGVEIPASS